MRHNYLDSSTTTDLCSEELRQINGGNYQTGYNAGQYVGALVKQVIEGVSLLDWLFL